VYTELAKLRNIKFHANLFSSSRGVKRGETEENGQHTVVFLQFFVENAPQNEITLTQQRAGCENA
jgi:hypothetical protein